jgi:hypothetical protein
MAIDSLLVDICHENVPNASPESKCPQCSVFYTAVLVLINKQTADSKAFLLVESSGCYSKLPDEGLRIILRLPINVFYRSR